MKYKIEYTKSFQKGLKRAEKRGFDLERLREVVEKLQQGETLDERYRDHKLKGNKADYRECHIQPDWLLIYKIDNKVLILTLVATGSHSELLGI